MIDHSQSTGMAPTDKEHCIVHDEWPAGRLEPRRAVARSSKSQAYGPSGPYPLQIRAPDVPLVISDLHPPGMAYSLVPLRLHPFPLSLVAWVLEYTIYLGCTVPYIF